MIEYLTGNLKGSLFCILIKMRQYLHCRNESTVIQGKSLKKQQLQFKIAVIAFFIFTVQ